MDAPIRQPTKWDILLRNTANDHTCYFDQPNSAHYNLGGARVTILTNLDRLNQHANDIFKTVLDSKEALRHLDTIFKKTAIALNSMRVGEREEIISKCVNLYLPMRQLLDQKIDFPWLSRIPRQSKAEQFKEAILESDEWLEYDSTDKERLSKFHRTALDYFESLDKTPPDPTAINMLVDKFAGENWENPDVADMILLINKDISRRYPDCQLTPRVLDKLLSNKGSKAVWRCFVMHWRGNPQLLGSQSTFFSWMRRDLSIILNLLSEKEFRAKFKEIIAYYDNYLTPTASDYSIDNLHLAVLEFALFCEEFPQKEYIPERVLFKIRQRAEMEYDPFELPLEISGTQLWALTVSTQYFHGLATIGKSASDLTTKRTIDLLPLHIPKENFAFFIEHVYNLKTSKQLTFDERLAVIQVAKNLGADSLYTHFTNAIVDDIKIKFEQDIKKYSTIIDESELHYQLQTDRHLITAVHKCIEECRDGECDKITEKVVNWALKSIEDIETELKQILLKEPYVSHNIKNPYVILMIFENSYYIRMIRLFDLILSICENKQQKQVYERFNKSITQACLSTNHFTYLNGNPLWFSFSANLNTFMRLSCISSEADEFVELREHGQYKVDLRKQETDEETAAEFSVLKSRPVHRPDPSLFIELDLSTLKYCMDLTELQHYPVKKLFTWVPDHFDHKNREDLIFNLRAALPRTEIVFVPQPNN